MTEDYQYEDPEAAVEDPYAEARMTVLEHLTELRRRLLYSVIAVFVMFGVSWAFVREIFEYVLMTPLKRAAPHLEIAQMHHKDLAEPFFVLLKTAIFSGVFFALPFIIFQVWQFIAPGLYDHEKKSAVPFVTLSSFFFVTGSFFCWWVVMPLGYGFLLQFSDEISTPQLMMNEYLSISTKLLIGFGLVFQLPVFAMFLSKLGVITHRTLIKYWRYAAVAAVILAAMLTPPDVVTQVLMAGPLIILYLISILIAYVNTINREKRLAKEEEEFERALKSQE